MCVCFITGSILFLEQMIAKSQEENIIDLYSAVKQTGLLWRSRERRRRQHE